MKTFILFFLVSISIFAQNKSAFINGKIYTVNEKQPFAEAVVVYDNKILFVGSNEDAKKYYSSSDNIIDLNGKLMLPGFIDNHTHFIRGGLYLNGIDLRPAQSRKEFSEIIKNYAETHKERWITGGYWNHENWEVTDLPTKEMIDEFTPNTPVFVARLDGHMALANSYALKLAGVTKDTESPSGGEIVKDPITGEPTGVLKDEAMSFVYKVIPPASENELLEGAYSALAYANSLGLTSVQDMFTPNEFKVFQEIEKRNELTIRIYSRHPISYYKNLVNAGVNYGFGSERLKIGSLKAFADGSLGSSTAWFFEPYDQDPNTSGLAMSEISDGSLRKMAIDADKNKLQLSVHAIGDKANSYMLDLFEEIKNINPNWDRRFRMEHAQHVRFQDIPRFREIGVVASVQPYHAIDDGVWAEKRIGKRIEYTYPFRTFLDEGVLLCFGSDWYVAPLSPILGIYAAVTRRTLDDKNPGGWIPEQKISVEEAIKCYTINNAYAAFEEEIKGSIETGKFADFVILNDDILTIEPEKIKDVTVYMTVLDGKIVYQAR